MKRLAMVLCWIAGLALFFWCSWHSVRHYADWRRVGYEEKSVTAWREAARATDGEGVGILCQDAETLSPTDRTRLIAANWELGDKAARPVGLRDGIGDVCQLLVPRFCGRATRYELEEMGYGKSFDNAVAEVWTKESRPLHPMMRPKDRIWRDVLWMIPVLLLLGLVVMLGAGMYPRPNAALFIGFAVFAVLAASEVSHPLLAPNGLAVYAGKAKLFLTCGIPEGFWTDPRFATYQPSYPPGLTGLSILAYMCIGHCSDVAVQLLVPFALALVCWLGLESTTNPMRWAAVLALVLCPKAQEMSAGFYAEPFAALAIVVGLRRVSVRRNLWGWIIVGLAGLFRHEGLLLAVGLVVFRSGGPWRHRVLALVAAATPGLLWQLFVHCADAGLYDFDWMSGPSAGHLAEAGRLALSLCFERVWEVGAVLLWTVLLVLCGESQGRRARQMRVLAFGLTATVVGVLLLGFSTTPYFTWMASATLPRYIWLAFVPALAGVGSVGDCPRMIK